MSMFPQIISAEETNLVEGLTLKCWCTWTVQLSLTKHVENRKAIELGMEKQILFFLNMNVERGVEMKC